MPSRWVMIRHADGVVRPGRVLDHGIEPSVPYVAVQIPVLAPAILGALPWGPHAEVSALNSTVVLIRPWYWKVLEMHLDRTTASPAPLDELLKRAQEVVGRLTAEHCQALWALGGYTALREVVWPVMREMHPAATAPHPKGPMAWEPPRG